MLGRPSVYTQELADRICAELSDGKSLRSVCRADDMPDKSTVFRWLRTIDGFRDQYEKSKEESADAHSEDMLDIADDASNDWMSANDPDNPGYKLNGEHVQRSRLRIDVRKWIASKLKPKKYGDRVGLEHSGADGGPLIVQVLQFADHTDSERVAAATLPAAVVDVSRTGREEV